MTYSEIVNELQGDKEKAEELLVDVAIEQQKMRENIKKLKLQLEKENRYYQSTMNKISLICKHIKMNNTFHIVKGNKYYFFYHRKATISTIDWLL